MKTVLFAIAMMSFSGSVFAQDQYHLIETADFGFAAPIVSNSNHYTNTLPFGSIVYDANSDRFEGLDRNGTWAPMTIPGGAPNVSSSGNGQYHIEGASVSCASGTCTISSQSGTWISSVTRTIMGEYTLTVPTGEWSIPPYCVVNQYNTNGLYACANSSNNNTTTAVYVACEDVQTLTTADSNFNIICMGTH